jgi:two-component system, NtrC family, nitrogen regulation sensor histidine kinase GlnL
MTPEQAKHILNNLSASVLYFDARLYLRAINPAGEDLLSLSDRQGCGLHVNALFPHATRFIQSLQRVCDARAPMSEYGIVLRLLHGRHITVDYTITPLSDTPPHLDILVEMIDVDHHLRLAREETWQTQQQAAQTVIRGLAHEIRNPLGGLRGAAQLLARELPAPHLQEYTDIIIGEADRLQKLLDQLLGPRRAPQQKATNVHRILARVQQLVRGESGAALRLITDFDPSLPDVFVDPDQLLQALLNIARNAVQAMNGGGELILRTRIRRKITLGQQRQTKLAVQIDIQDNGPGIPEEIREQIFYPMITGRADGTGLGLSIAQSLLNHNGGLIGYSSEAGCTVFSLWLPIAPTLDPLESA